MARIFSFEEGVALSCEVGRWLKPLCTRTALVGGMRRRLAAMAQLDILAIPRCRQALGEELENRAISGYLYINRNTEWKKRFLLIGTGHVICLHLSTWEEWWSRLVWSTGSDAFSRKLAQAARRKGLRIGPNGAPIVRPDGCVAKLRSEKGVFWLLGVDWVSPENRL